MMNLKSLQTAAVVSKKLKLSDDHHDATAIVMRCFPSSGNRPTTYSCVFFEDTSIAYKHPKSKNEDEAKKNYFICKGDELPLELKGGGESHMISIFKGPNVTDGCFYNFQDLSYHKWKKSPNDNEMISISARRIEKVKMSNKREVIYSLFPFPVRSISFNRDLSLEREICNPKRHFLVVEFPGLNDIPENPEISTIYGKFSIPPPGVAPKTSYDAPIDKNAQGGPTKKLLAMVGTTSIEGENVNAAPDNQLMLMQYDDEDKSKMIVLGFTKLYEDSLNRLQMNWEIMAQTIIPFMSGLGLFTIDAKKSSDLALDDVNYRGVIKMQGSVHFDLASMVRQCGFRMSVESCIQMEPKLNEDWITSLETKMDSSSSDAINLLVYNGCLKGFKKGATDGNIEFYVVTNLPMNMKKRDKLRQMKESEIVTELMDEANYSIGDKYVAIFAMCTVGYTGFIHDFTFGGK